MGTWGTQPWENDAAADWFNELFTETQLDDFILRTLRLDPINSGDEIRAAAFVLTRLAEIHVWRLASLETCLKLAERKLVEFMAHAERNTEAEQNFARQAAQPLLDGVQSALAKITSID